MTTGAPTVQLERLASREPLRNNAQMPDTEPRTTPLAPRFLLSCALLCAVTASACAVGALNVSVAMDRSRPALAPRPTGCPIEIFQADAAAPPRCQRIGEIAVGELGWLDFCELDQSMDRLRQEACLAGADAARVTAVEPPPWNGVCHKVFAELLECADEEEKG